MVCLLFRKMGRDVINKSNIQIKNIKVIDNRNRMRNFQNRETKKEKKKINPKEEKKKHKNPGYHHIYKGIQFIIILLTVHMFYMFFCVCELEF